MGSATAIPVVDGLESFWTEFKGGHNKNLAFFRILANIGNLAFGKVFLMACCTATVTSFKHQIFMISHRHRVFLPVALLEPPCISQDDGSSSAVFDESDHVIKVFVSDCGGHGRALEGLQEVLEVTRKDFNFELLMTRLYDKLFGSYSGALLMPSTTIQAMGRAILTRAYLDPDKPLPRTSSSPGELSTLGLIRYEQPHGLGTGGYLVAPYIWAWLLSHKPREGADPPLNNWRLCNYSDPKSKVNPRSPSGANFGNALNTSFTNHHLKLDFSSQQVDTKYTSDRPLSALRCEPESVDVRKGEHCVINTPSVPYGHSFIRLDSQPLRTEVHQCKLITDGGGIDYQAERSKTASGRDFFMLFTSQYWPDVELPPLSGIVDRSNWTRYFGPYASRAFVFAIVGALDINLAPRKYLKGMEGIDDKEADFIIQERTKREFDSYEDAVQRLRDVDETVLKRFKLPQTA
ncbi:hypothetical protein BGX24_012315 [Mortierella sp. AD032]|nr:hypothetical protein BGX24_012315 [Mortierella sp. AD032]